jgi:hypothetical protein
MSIIEESSWILSQLGMNTYPLFCKKMALEQAERLDLFEGIRKEDIVSFLKLHHVEKYDVSIGSFKVISHFKL